MRDSAPEVRTPFFKRGIWRGERSRSSAACCLEIDLSIKRLMTVRVFSCFCDNVILPSFITFIGYQKETKSQVNPKVTLSQVNNTCEKECLLIYE